MELKQSPYIYETDTYVHNPKTNGRVAAWIDTNGTATSNLYMTADVRNNDSRPVLVDSGVTQYGVRRYIYSICKRDSSIFLYFLEDKEIYKLLPENEYGVLTSVYNEAISWLNTTYSTRNKDEIKYVKIK